LASVDVMVRANRIRGAVNFECFISASAPLLANCGPAKPACIFRQLEASTGEYCKEIGLQVQLALDPLFERRETNDPGLVLLK
jgi:hypothetical protein